MSATATSKRVRISPRKVSEVAALVRGRTVADALVILEHTPRRSALDVLQAVKSAAANAEHNHNYKPGTLFISQISVTAGPRYRRWRPVARGRANRYARKSSHIQVVVDGEQRQIKKPAAKAVAASQADKKEEK